MAVSYRVEDIQRWLQAGTLTEQQAIEYLTALLVAETDPSISTAAARTQAQSVVSAWLGRAPVVGASLAPAGGDGASMSAAGQILGQKEIELGGLPTFLQTLRGAGVPQEGPFAAWARGQYAPAVETYFGMEAARGGGIPRTSESQIEMQPFTDFLKGLGITGTGGGLSTGVGRAATQAYKDIQAKAIAGETAPGYAFVRPYAAPETAGEFGYGAGLASQAATGRLGGLAAQYLMPSESDLYERFLSGKQPATSNWLPWLKQYLGF